jgi:hypothetical protein
LPRCGGLAFRFTDVACYAQQGTRKDTSPQIRSNRPPRLNAEGDLSAGRNSSLNAANIRLARPPWHRPDRRQRAPVIAVDRSDGFTQAHQPRPGNTFHRRVGPRAASLRARDAPPRAPGPPERRALGLPREVQQRLEVGAEPRGQRRQLLQLLGRGTPRPGFPQPARGHATTHDRHSQSPSCDLSWGRVVVERSRWPGLCPAGAPSVAIYDGRVLAATSAASEGG